MNRILLYGATGYTGRLIAEEAARRRKLESKHPESWRGDITLASRDRDALRRVAEGVRLPYLAFGLDDSERPRVIRALQAFDVVINAASPFARTAPRLAKAALDARRHYVDLNGEVDVYRRVDDLEPIAAQRRVAMVSGAGWTSVVSDVLLDHALRELAKGDKFDKTSLQTLRIAVSRVPFVSRGSALTMSRAVREQVGVVRDSKLTHVPVGQLERTFDFCAEDEPGARRLAIASAANLLDTLSAKHTVERLGMQVPDIESYIEMSGAQRLGYQFGAMSAVAMHVPLLRRWAAVQLALLPDGPSSGEREANRQTLVVQIENRLRQLVAHWALETPDPYLFSARSALDIAVKLARQAQPLAAGKCGWLTPSALLCDGAQPLAGAELKLPFGGCVLRDRLQD